MTGATVPFLDPTGTPRMIPSDQATAAAAAGGKPAVKMVDPTGTPRWIPSDQQQAAMAAGGKLYTDPGSGGNGAVTSPAAPQEPAQSSWERLRTLGLRGWINNNMAYNEAHADDNGAVAGALNHAGLGFAKGLIQTAGFGAHLLSTIGDMPSYDDVNAYKAQHPQATDDEAMAAAKGQLKDQAGNALPAYRAPQHQQRAQQLKDAADWFKSQGDTHGFFEGLGSTGEQLVEILGTDGLGELAELQKAEAAGDAVKASSLADRLKNVQGVATVLEKYPKIAKLVEIGLRTTHAAAKAGATAAAQTYVHTQGDPTATAEAGAGGALLGGAVDGASQAAGALVSHLSPEMREIAGKWVPVLRSQVTRTAEDGSPIRPSKLQEVAATTENSPKVVGQQQAGANDAIQGAAQQVVGDELGKVNATRTAPTNALPSSTEPYTFRIEGTPTQEDTEGQIAQDARKKQIGTRVLPGKGPANGVAPYDPSGFAYRGEEPATEVPSDGEPSPVEQPAGSHRSPQFQYLTDSKPPAPAPQTDVARGGAVLETQDPKLAHAHLESLNRIMGSDEFASMSPDQQAGITRQAADIDRQMGEYRMAQKGQQPFRANFAPHIIPAAIKATSSFGDAANILAESGKQVYEHLNAVSGGEWQPLNNRINTLQEKYWQATGSARDEIAQALHEAHGQVDEIFAHPQAGVDRADLQAAKGAWRASYALRDLHNALQPAYDVDADFAKRTGEYRGMNGQQLLGRFRAALARNPELKVMLGPKTTDNLQGLFRLNSSMASRARFGEGVSKIARWVVNRSPLIASAGVGYAVLGREGAAIAGSGAEALYGATRFVLHKLATDPDFGKSFRYALEYGAKPENFADTLGRQLVRKAIPLAATTAAEQVSQ